MGPPTFLVLALAFLARAGDPPDREPAADAPSGEAFSWSSAGGLRFTWVLPAGYDGRAQRHLTVVLHGRGADMNWAREHHPPGRFRARDVVVAVEGTSEGRGAERRFLTRAADERRFAAFLDELRATFAVERVFLYGHDQGGTFAAFFAGQHPDAVAGVVVHGASAWDPGGAPYGLRQVPLVLLHGTEDDQVPFHESVRARDEMGTPLTRLRRLQGHGHGPDAERAGEALTWCQGIRAPTMEEALECARELLRVKPGPEAPVDYSGARTILARFEPPPRPVTGPGALPPEERREQREHLFQARGELADQARDLIRALDDAAGAQLAELERKLPRKALALDGRAWLGHLIALREDFRGAPALEKLAAELDLDALRRQHQRAAEPIFRALAEARTPEPLVACVVATIGSAYLADGFPAELVARVDGALRADPELGAELARDLDDYRDWKQGWREGLEEYERLWRRWKTPDPPR